MWVTLGNSSKCGIPFANSHKTEFPKAKSLLILLLRTRFAQAGMWWGSVVLSGEEDTELSGLK